MDNIIIEFDCRKSVIKNPFNNLLEMVEYYYSLSDMHDMEAIRCFASWATYPDKEKYPKLCDIVYDMSVFLQSQIIPDKNSVGQWMDFDEERLHKLLREPFFQEYNDTIVYDGKDNTLISSKCTDLISWKGHGKFPFLAHYAFYKLQSIAVKCLPSKLLADIWYDWCYNDMIDYVLRNNNWYGIISDVYISKGKNWFYDTANYYPSLGLDPCMYRWACYGIEACQQIGSVDSKVLKKDLTDLYSELLIASVRCGSLEKNKYYLDYIQNAINNFEDVKIENLNKKMASLQHENEQLLSDKKSMEETMDVLKKQIAKLGDDSSRTEYEKVEAIAKRIYAMMPDETSDTNKTEHKFNEIWVKLSDDTRKDINRAIRFFQDMGSIDVALFLMIRNVEREFARHFFIPFQKSNLFKNMGFSLCSNHRYVKTDEALKDTTKHPTMGNIPYIGKAVSTKNALDASVAIAAFSKFLGNSKTQFCDICKNIESYRVGIKKNKIVDIRNIFAHGNDDKNSAYDKTSYDDVVKFLYEPPLQILFKIVMISKLKV